MTEWPFTLDALPWDGDQTEARRIDRAATDLGAQGQGICVSVAGSVRLGVVRGRKERFTNPAR